MVRFQPAPPKFGSLRRKVIRLLYTESDEGSSPSRSTKIMKTYETIRQELDDLIAAKVSPDVFFEKLAELHAKEISDEIDRIVMEEICPVISPVEDHIDIVRVAGSTPAPGTKIMGL